MRRSRHGRTDSRLSRTLRPMVLGEWRRRCPECMTLIEDWKASKLRCTASTDQYRTSLGSSTPAALEVVRLETEAAREAVRLARTATKTTEELSIPIGLTLITAHAREFRDDPRGAGRGR